MSPRFPAHDPATAAAKPRGIAPALLVDQVRNTAAWALVPSFVLPCARAFRNAHALERAWRTPRSAPFDLAYLHLLLAAHFTTVATFVPTDVDQAIRVHVWSRAPREALSPMLDLVTRATRWDERHVSNRTVTVDGITLSGHRGEWFSVFAGALGRAITLKDEAAMARASAWIDAELEREHTALQQLRREGDDATLLSAVTTIAHNLGDLSRVVDTWSPMAQMHPLAARYRRLGHDASADEGASPVARFRAAFVYAGDINKRWMALENHRFLPLRQPRALRAARARLLPFGPYLFGWGERLVDEIAEPRALVEVLDALLTVHERRPAERGCLRAIAGIHHALLARGHRQGVLSLAHDLGKVRAGNLHRGGVQAALRQPEREFLAVFHRGLPR
jgi:hypothetical protein